MTEQFKYFPTIITNIITERLSRKRIKVDSSDKPWIIPEIKTPISNGRRHGLLPTTWCLDSTEEVNTLCKKARSKYYRIIFWLSILILENGGQCWRVCYLIMFEGKSYSDEDLANHRKDKFVAVGSSSPCLVWLSLPVDGVPAEFYISVEDTVKALLLSKLHSSELYFLTHQFAKDLFLHCRSQQILHQFRNFRLQ